MAHASLVAMQTVLSALAIVAVGGADIWLIDHIWNTVDDDIRAGIAAACWAILLITTIKLVVSSDNPARLLFRTESLGDAIWYWIFAVLVVAAVAILLVIHCQTIRRVARIKSDSED